MSNARRIRMEFPLAGLNRGLGYQRQPPYSSPSLQNCRARETFENRARGGSRPGLGKEFSERVSGASNPIRLTTQVSIVAGTPAALVHRVVASANGELWVADASADLIKLTLPTATSTIMSLSSDKLIQAVQRGTTLYIADYAMIKTGVTCTVNLLQNDQDWPGTVTGVKDNGTTTITCSSPIFQKVMAGTIEMVITAVGTFAIATYTSPTVVVVTGDASGASGSAYYLQANGGGRRGNYYIDSMAGVSDFTTLGITPYVDAVHVTGASNTGVTTYLVAGVEATKLWLDATHAVATSSLDAGVAVQLGRPPLRLHTDGTLLARMSAGVSGYPPPMGCPLIALYSDSLVFAGEASNPHVYYISRQGDATDYDYSQTDQQAAYAGVGSAAGEPGEPITALIPFSNDYLIFGCTNSLYRMRGDPRLGGVLELISRKVGVLYRGAWCQSPRGEVYFLSQDGLYVMPPGAMGFPQALSEDRLPQELANVDTGSYEVTMVYNPQQEGVHIYLTEIATGGTKWHWFYSTEAKAFMPDLYQAAHEPFSVHYLASHDPTKSKVLLGCRDGYVRSYSDDNVNDDGTEIASYAVYGPISLGSADGYRWGVVRELVPTLAQGLATKTVDYYVVVADTAEEAVDKCTDVTGTAAAGAPVYDSGNLVSTVIATTAILTRQMVGRKLTFGTSGNTFVIASFDSTTQVKVDGDASGEAGSQALTISGIFESGTWARGKNLFARPRAGGAAFCLKLQNTTGSDYGPWGIEGINCTIESKGKHRRLA